MPQFLLLFLGEMVGFVNELSVMS